MKNIVFKSIAPKILYFGTPVALITTLDRNGNANIGPMSSVWALGWTLMLGLGCNSKTYQNLVEQKECVINLPSAALFNRIEKIANLTGLNPVPENKQAAYKFDPDKFLTGGFTSLSSEKVNPPRIAECQLQLEAVLKNIFHLDGGSKATPGVTAMEVKVLKVHVDKQLIIDEKHIDPQKWDPLIYNFRHYFGLSSELGKNFRAEV